jgi:hypothetical protein
MQEETAVMVRRFVRSKMNALKSGMEKLRSRSTSTPLRENLTYNQDTEKPLLVS